MTIARRRFLTASALLAAGAGLARTAQAKVQPVKLENRKFEPLKLPRPISLAALTGVSPAPPQGEPSVPPSNPANSV